MQKITASLLLLLVAGLFTTAQPEEVPVIEFKDLKQYLNRSDNQLYVVNFWATWCKPCVKELPYFNRIEKEYGDQGVQVLLVSLDFTSNLASKVNPFVKKRDLAPLVMLLDQPSGDAWINKISNNWSGAIPATLLIRNGQNSARSFHEKSFTYAELKNLVTNHLN